MKRLAKLHIRFAAAMLLGVAASFSACSTVAKITQADAKNGKLFAVSNDGAAFYRYGPQQGNGPDEKLPKDTLLTLIRPSFGYCKVQLVSGAKEGYVASEDIKPAPPTLVAALTKPPPSPVSTSAPENFDVQNAQPPPPETLPAPDLPPPTDTPPPP
ncbi:MAG TPA: hypothetical protein VGC85_04990 [Chthoniobacterales bacterium]|jgi:hypothetical protein